MKHNYGDCYYCGGEVKEKVIQIEHRWKGKLYLIDKVPVGVCQQCGEKYLASGVYKGLERLAKSKNHLMGKMTVDILAFEASAAA